MMEIRNFLELNKSQIISEWFKLVISTYSFEAGKYFLNKDKRFSNPVGYTINEQLGVLFEYLIDSKWCEKYEKALDQILKIRAVQEFEPSNVVGFIMKLKEAISHILELNEIKLDENELKIINSRVEEILLKSFDRFMVIREKLCQIRINEIKARTQLMIEKINKRYANMGMVDE